MIRFLLLSILFFSIASNAADRTLKKLSNLSGGASDNTDSPAIPSGKSVVLKSLLVADAIQASSADQRSCAYLVQFGTPGAFTEIVFAAVSGNTVKLDIDDELIGDGSKFVRVTRQNFTALSKRCPFILKAYDK